MSHIDQINCLLTMIHNFKKFRIHDYYVVELIKDIVIEHEEEENTTEKKINIEIFQGYIDFIKNNPEYVPYGYKPDGYPYNNSKKSKNSNQPIYIDQSKRFRPLYLEELEYIKDIFMKMNHTQ